MYREKQAALKSKKLITPNALLPFDTLFVMRNVALRHHTFFSPQVHTFFPLKLASVGCIELPTRHKS